MMLYFERYHQWSYAPHPSFNIVESSHLLVFIIAFSLSFIYCYDCLAHNTFNFLVTRNHEAWQPSCKLGCKLVCVLCAGMFNLIHKLFFLVRYTLVLTSREILSNVVHHPFHLGVLNIHYVISLDMNPKHNQPTHILYQILKFTGYANVLFLFPMQI